MTLAPSPEVARTDAPSSVPEWFESWADAQPDALAIESGQSVFTYARLDAEANRMARRLRALGVDRGDVVGVLAERGPVTVVAALGALKAGAAYAPLDPDSPRLRTHDQIAGLRAGIVVSPAHLASAVEAAGPPVIALDQDLDALSDEEPERLDVTPEPGDLYAVVFTSGSTGRPKGVAIEHRNIVNLLLGAPDLKPRAGEGTLQVCAPQFDVAAYEIWATLLSGARLVCHPPGRPDPRAVCATVREGGVTWSVMATSTFHQLAESGCEELSGLRLLLVGGEALLPRYARRFRAACPETRLFNIYGPCETTVMTFAHEVGDEVESDDPVPVGRPIAGARVEVLDERGEPVAPGERGELYVGGPGISRGYLHQPDLTAERFLADGNGGRLYRTGDIVRVRPDGALEIFGRTDDQVKVRGYRVEPREVEAQLTSCPGVERAAVVAQEYLPGHRRLVAYVVLGESASRDAIRAFLEERLPGYLVPSAIVVVDDLPMSPNGKVDRAALRSQAPRGTVVPEEGRAARSPLEEEIAGIFADVLGLPAVGAEDDFFALGGDSLLALQVLARLHGGLDIELPIAAIFEAPTAAKLALCAAEDPHAAEPPLPELRARKHAEWTPVSAGQAKTLLISELAEESLPYQSQAMHRIRGRLDVGALERALTAMVARHEILRTTFARAEGRWMQRVHDPAPVRLGIEDLRAESDPEAALREHFEHECGTRIDPGRLPLVRWALARLADDDHALIAIEHHSVHDGFSTALFLRELAELYSAEVEGRAPALEPVSIQYRDFVAWQDEVLQSERGRRTLEHWRERLADPPSPPELPVDHPRPPRQTYRGTSLRLTLSAELADRLGRRARECDATVFMVMLAAWGTLLARYGAVDEVIVGSGVANRRTLTSEQILGMVVNTVPLRLDLSGDPTVSDAIARVRDTVLDAHAHQDVPFEKVVEYVAPERSTNASPLYQTLFSFHDSPVRTLSVPGATIIPRDTLPNGSSKADVSLIVINRRGDTSQEDAGLSDDGVTIVWEYNTDLFERTTAERMLGQFHGLLEEIAAPGDRPLASLPVGDEEEQARLRAFTGTTRPYERDASIAEVFAARAAETPHAVAVSLGRETLGYARLDRWANRLAHRLRALGAGPGSRVGVCLERSVEMVVAYLAILKAGAAYVPLDPRDPSDRLRRHTDALGIERVLSLARHRDALPTGSFEPMFLDDTLDLERELDTAPAPSAGPLDPAYVMFTSGSTGTPKGVEVPQRAVVRLVRGADYVHLGPDETLLQLAPASFDAATFEIWGALLNGGRLALAPPGPLAPAELADVVAQERVTTLWLTAGLFHHVVDARPEMLRSPRQLLAGGDVLSPDHVRRALRALPPGGVLINGYGPTEGTTFTTTHRMEPGRQIEGAIPIGRPIANTRVYILDRERKPVPIGAIGELYLGGDGVALGYVGDPELTARRFLPDHFAEAGERMYRTGDRARWREDGTVEFLGRADRQLKVRGFRIEPGEVEEALRSHPAVADVFVTGHRREGRDRTLVAYVVAAAARPTIAELRAHAARALPAYEVPTGWRWLERLPLAPTGKVDAAALPDPDYGSADDGGTADRRGLDPLERRLTEIWERALDAEGIGPDDDFFAVGGHSLLAIEVFDAIERSLGQRLPLAMIFEAPTIRLLAAALREEAAPDTQGSLVTLTPTGDRPPLFFVAAGDGNSVGFGALARRLGPEQPFFALQPRGVSGGALLQTRVEHMAAHYLREIRRVREHGPYLLGGRCLGAAVAYEMARRLVAEGEDVPLVVVLDSGGPRWEPRVLADGTPFDEYVNRALRHAAPEFELADPFSPEGTRRLVAWLLEPAVRGADGTPVNRYLHEFYRAQTDLRDRFPDLAGGDARAYLDWVCERRLALGLPTRFMPRSESPLEKALFPLRRAHGLAITARHRVAWRAAEVADLALGQRRRDAAARRRDRLREAAAQAIRAYRAGPYAGAITLIRSDEYRIQPLVDRWHGLDTAAVIERHVPGTHRSMMREPDVAALATCISELVDEVIDGADERDIGAPEPAAAP